jgi:predicted acyltransferase
MGSVATAFGAWIREVAELARRRLLVSELLTPNFTMAEAMVDPSAGRLYSSGWSGHAGVDRAVEATAPRSARLRSLDAMRGLTVAAMIVVNNPGSWTNGYAPLAHSAWNGWTLADLVFPFFLLIVGVSLDLSLARHTVAIGGRFAPLPALARRALLLCALGLFLNAFPNFSDLGALRIFGVLQRIGLCSFVTGVVLLATGVRGQITVAALLLGGYWALMLLVPVPGHGPGVLTREGNLAAWFDTRWFDGHLYRDGFDPEGLVSSIPAVATTLLGALAGRWLRSATTGRTKTLGLVTVGVVLVLGGELADRWFPINKQLWTSSYVLLTGGLGLVVLGIAYELVDRRGLTRPAAPAIMLGQNALAIYLLSSLVARLLELCQVPSGDSCESVRLFLYEHFFAPWAGAENGSLGFAVTYLLVWMVPTAELYRRRLFFRV